MLPTLPLAQRGTRLIAGHTGGGEAGSVPNQGREVVGWSWDHLGLNMAPPLLSAAHLLNHKNSKYLHYRNQ